MPTLRSLALAATNPPAVAPVRSFALAVTCAMALAVIGHASEPWVHVRSDPGNFPLVAEGQAATLVASTGDAKVVGIATADLARDIAQVTGATARVTADVWADRGPLVLIGTLGQSPAIDQLVAAHELDVGDLRGAWESFVITTTTVSRPNVRPALVIVGSDRRGTAFGFYELSRAIGVSPWHWWADVAPTHRDALYVAAGLRRFGPPSVRYRGIFLNDEDWGLQPWAAKTLEPEHGGIGPKTYTRLFELMLRLKANTVWPAMHPGIRPFNSFPENARIADEYAIVMGSSHAEPMLRDNVGEWKDDPKRYNYVTNREGVRAYWEERVKTNGRYENIYTIGMRGVHDSGIQGAKTDAERIRILEQVFADQRAMLARYAAKPERPGAASASERKDDGGNGPLAGARSHGGQTEGPLAGARSHVDEAGQPLAGARSHEDAGAADAVDIPQMFCAYKEVLGLYRQGLTVPDDVTIVWPDDNFGYIRNFATPEERKRRGGFGIYYHLSYLGAPMAYLWLYTTPLPLVWEEMSKAYDYGARTIWIANVGDLKPGEIGTEFFLDLAWDVSRWRHDTVPEFLTAWAAREFGPERAEEIAGIMREYYALNFQRKPEHLQWWLPKQAPRPSPFTRAEIEDRLAAFAALRARADAVYRVLPPEQRDAFFELVAYPVRGSALANERYFCGELAAFAPPDSAGAKTLATRATAADGELKEQTRVYNEQIAGGKWRGMMSLEPADKQWTSFRLSPWKLPVFARSGGTADAPSTGATGGRKIDAVRAADAISVEAEHFAAARAGKEATWQVIRGLGRTGDSVALFPTTAPAPDPSAVATDAARLDYPMEFAAAGLFRTTFYLIPTQPIVPEHGLRFAVALDDQPPQVVSIKVRDGSTEWAQGVLNATLTGTAPVQVTAAGRHVLHVYGIDPGVVLDKIVVDLGGLAPSYLGPPETGR